MKKRRRNIKPRFWVIMAVLVMACISLLVGCLNPEEAAIANSYVAEVEVVETPQVKDYILDIPLSCELQEELHEACEEFGVDYYVMIALIDRETKFKNVMGDGGDSYGYCQIQPKWWYDVMCEIGATDLNVPKDNFRTVCAIMSGLTKVYNSTEGALVAYNTGSYKGKSTAYSREIMANAERYRA